MKNMNFKLILGIASAVVLTACGGGGGGSSPTTSASTSSVTTGTLAVPVPVVDSFVSSLVTTPSVGSYTATSEELAAFNFLNAERLSCGFGSLAQNVQLDAAAKAHADYQLINNIATHEEDINQYATGFTGVDGLARALAAGYTGAGSVLDEFGRGIGVASTTGLGVQGLRSLLTAPYHVSGLMVGYRDVGISVRSSTNVGSVRPGVVLQFDLGYKTTAGQQLFASGDVKTYPCDGTTNINRQLKSEVPSPIPGRDLSVNPVGTPVYVQVRDGQVLTITNATMTQISTGLPVTLRATLTSANDTNSILKSNQAVIIPDGPLQANNSFQVTVSGTNNGAAFSRNFVFTTGSGG